MPQVTQITLNDGTKDLVFAPNGSNGSLYGWVNGDGILIKDKKLSISTRLTSTRRKITFKLEVPVVQDEVVNSISNPVQRRIAYATVNLDFAKQSLPAERTATRKLIADALVKAIFTDVVDNNAEIF